MVKGLCYDTLENLFANGGLGLGAHGLTGQKDVLSDRALGQMLVSTHTWQKPTISGRKVFVNLQQLVPV
jgi:hypothetical protein